LEWLHLNIQDCHGKTTFLDFNRHYLWTKDWQKFSWEFCSFFTGTFKDARIFNLVYASWGTYKSCWKNLRRRSRIRQYFFMLKFKFLTILSDSRRNNYSWRRTSTSSYKKKTPSLRGSRIFWSVWPFNWCSGKLRSFFGAIKRHDCLSQ